MLKVTVFVWGAYWGFVLLYGKAVEVMMQKGIEPPLWIAYFDKYYVSVLIFLANVLGTLIFYALLTKHFRALSNLRSRRDGPSGGTKSS